MVSTQAIFDPTSDSITHRLVWYYPLIGMMNMFISILKSPAAESITKNIGLIDMAAGYFAYLDHATNDILSFALVQNLAQWARQAVSQANLQALDTQSTHFAVGADITAPMHDFLVDANHDVCACC